jgi:hypothetical protein
MVAIDWTRFIAEMRYREAGMNRYHLLKAGFIGAALCIAIVGSTLGTARLQPRFEHPHYSAAVSMQAGLYRAGAHLGHLALKLFYFAR